jgi:MFS family permease
MITATRIGAFDPRELTPAFCTLAVDERNGSKSMVTSPSPSASASASSSANEIGVDPPLPRAVKVLGAVSLAQDAGSEMLYPFLPTFITGVLGAPVVAVGVAEGLADATAAGMKLLAGRLAASDRRRPWIAAGYGLATLGKLIVALAFVWPVVLLGRVVDRFGKGIRDVPRDALIADAVPERARGRAFGFHRALDTAGAVIGPLVGLGLYRLVGEKIRPVLLIAVIPAVISVALVAMIRERPAIPGAVARAAPAPITRTRLPARFWHVMLPVGAFALVNSTDALLLQRAYELGFDVTRIVLAYVAYNVVYAGLSYPAGKLADHIEPRLVFAAGLVVFAVTYVGLGQATGTTAAWVLLPLYGVYAALTDGVSRTWIANTVDDEHRTWALGVHGATTGLAVLVAGLWSGLAWNGTGQIPLTVSGATALGVAAWLVTRSSGSGSCVAGSSGTHGGGGGPPMPGIPAIPAIEVNDWSTTPVKQRIDEVESATSSST